MTFRGFNQKVINSVSKAGNVKIFRIGARWLRGIIDPVNQGAVIVKQSYNNIRVSCNLVVDGDF